MTRGVYQVENEYGEYDEEEEEEDAQQMNDMQLLAQPFYTYDD